MEFVKVNIDDLIPATYNPRVSLKRNSQEYNKIKNSIKEFGYCEPIICNSDLTIIGGHQRLKVLKDLGYTEIEIIKVNLNKQQEKALNIALNKITGQWDMAKLNDLLEDLAIDGFDISLTGFELDDIEGFDIEPKGTTTQETSEKENARMNTIRGYNLQLYDPNDAVGKWGMPFIKNDGVIPSDLIGFNYMLSNVNKECGVHCFVDDYQFERLWNQPEAYIDKLREYQCVLSPDFSLYMDMPMAMKLWNIYRSRLLGNYWQRNGIKVIPTISWAEKETFEFCFDGIEEGSIVAVSTIGVKREDEAFQIWKDGMDAMIEIIIPKTIIVYGGVLDYDYKGIEVIYFDNKVTERMKDYGR